MSEAADAKYWAGKYHEAADEIERLRKERDLLAAECVAARRYDTDVQLHRYSLSDRAALFTAVEDARAATDAAKALKA